MKEEKIMSARDWGNTILSFIGDVLPELIGAAVGVYGGYRYGLRQERRLREENEKERKEDMIKSLITEVTDNKRTFDKGLQSMKFSGTTNVRYLEKISLTDAFDSTVFSGSYQLLTVETQRYVSWFFRGCKRMNLLLDRLRFCTTDVEARDISHEIVIIFPALKEGSIDTISRLQEELGYPWQITLTEEKGKE